MWLILCLIITSHVFSSDCGSFLSQGLSVGFNGYDHLDQTMTPVQSLTSCCTVCQRLGCAWNQRHRKRTSRTNLILQFHSIQTWGRCYQNPIWFDRSIYGKSSVSLPIIWCTDGWNALVFGRSTHLITIGQDDLWQLDLQTIEQNILMVWRAEDPHTSI